MAYRLHVEKQSVSLEVDMKTRTIKGVTKLLLNIVEEFENNENAAGSVEPKQKNPEQTNENQADQNNQNKPEDEEKKEEDIDQQQQHQQHQQQMQQQQLPESMMLHLHAQQLSVTAIGFSHLSGDNIINLQEYYYMGVDQQNSILSGMLNVPSSLDSYMMYHRKCYEYKDISGIQLIFSVNQDCMQQAIDRQQQDDSAIDGLQYSGMVTIEYTIIDPIAGIRFLSNTRYSNTQHSEFDDIHTEHIRETVLVTEYFPRSGQFWMPCQDREVFLSELCVSTRSDPIKIQHSKTEHDYLALCSGDLTEHLIDEKGLVMFKYSINKKIKADHIGIALGRFKTMISKNTSQQVLVACSLGVDASRLDLALITTDAVLKAISQQQLQDLSEYLNVYKLIFIPNLSPLSSSSVNVFKQDDNHLTPFNSHKLIANSAYNYQETIISNFNSSIDSLPSSFYKLGFIDEHFLPPTVSQTHSEQTIRALNFFKVMNFSICQQKVAISSRYHVDFWILLGIAGFMTDLYHKQLLSDKENAFEFRLLMAKQFERLSYQVEQGEELSALSTNDELCVGFEKFVDEVFILKARLVFHVLATRCNSKGSEFVSSVLDSVEKGQKITTELLFRIINRKHSIKDQHFKRQFIESTGIPHFEFKYEDSRKENKISVEVTQSALQEEYFRYHNYVRNELEKKNGIHSAAMKLLESESIYEDTNGENDEKLEDKQPSPSGNGGYDDGNNQYKKSKILKENLGNGRLIVPQILKSSRFFQGKLELIVTEVRDKDQQNTSANKDDELRVLALDKNYKFTRDVAYRSETRKNNGKKKDDDDDNAANNANDNKKKTYGQKKLLDELEKVWIKIDPLKKYFLSLDFPKQNLHSLLTQLMKDKKNRYKYISVTLFLLRQLRNKDYGNDSYDVAKNLKLIVQKDELETELQVEILDVIMRNSQKSKRAQQEAMSLLEDLLKKHVISADKSLLPNNFESNKKVQVLMTIIRGLSAYHLKNKGTERINKNNNNGNNSGTNNNDNNQNNGNQQQSVQNPPENSVRYLLKLLRENDNSINRYDDSLYRSNLIGSLLLTNHPYFTKRILNEVLRCLEQEYVEGSFNGVVLKALMINYTEFLRNNGLHDFSTTQRVKDIAITDESDENSQQLLRQIHLQLAHFKKLNNQSHMKTIQLYDRFLKIQEENKQYLPHQLFMHLIKEVETARTQFCQSQDYLNYLAIIRQYVHVNMSSFVEDMQFKQEFHQNVLFAQIVWEQLVSNPSLFNPFVRLHWIKIYRDIYFHWAPLCTSMRRHAIEEEDLGFCVDKAWANWSKSENDKKDQSDEQKFGLILKQKKRKRINSDFNIQDYIMSFCKKNKDKVNVIGISKHILDFLIKQFDNDKKSGSEFSGHAPINDGSSNKIAIHMTLNSFKLLKKSLKKDKYKSFDEVKRATLQVADEYLTASKPVTQKKMKNLEQIFILKKQLINGFFETAQSVCNNQPKKSKINHVIDHANQQNNALHASSIKSQIKVPSSAHPQQFQLQPVQGRRVSIQEEKNSIIRFSNPNNASNSQGNPGQR